MGLTEAARAQRLNELRPWIERAQHMQGWTFEIEPAPLGPPPAWDYVGRARQLAVSARSILDLGTGGGEVLVEALAGFKGLAVASEAWPPNVGVAARKLAQVGAHVVHTSSLLLPFVRDSFHLVLDRHEELDPAEVARVLAPGGRVLTQQIHPDFQAELREFFPRMTRFEPHDVLYRTGFEAAGLQIVAAQQHERPVAYRGLGELVYELMAAPWTIPDFNLEADLDALLEVEARLGRAEGIVLVDRRYLIEAHKPK
jgi:SAM-dependent methyltransferase